MKQYLELVNDVLTNGKRKPNRTGIDTISITGAMLKFDMSEKFPLLTTKKMGVKSIFAELEMFIKGIQSKKFLQDRGCSIWNEWCNPLKVPYGHDEATKEKMKAEDDLGRIYGVQWNSFGKGKTWEYFDPSTDENGNVKMLLSMRESVGINQLKNVIETLKKNPLDRRMIVTAWNPMELDQMALPPCHMIWQLVSDGEYVDLMFTMRSLDIFLGCGYDVAHYAMLLKLICAQVNMKPRTLILSVADAHLYVNHLDQAKELLTRIPYDLPTLEVIKNKPDDEWTIWDWNYTDFKLENYQSHPAIKAQIAV